MPVTKIRVSAPAPYKNPTVKELSGTPNPWFFFSQKYRRVSNVNKLKITPTPNKNGSYGIKGGVRMPYFRGPYATFLQKSLISTDFYAIQIPFVWHILGACFLQIWGVGVVRIIYKCRFSAELKNWKNYSSWGAASKNKSKKPWASIFTLWPCGNSLRCRFSESGLFFFAGAPTIGNKIEQNFQNTKVASTKVAYDTV